MDNNKKLEFFGELNTALVEFKVAAEKFCGLWEDGEFRLREDEVEQVRKFLKEMSNAAETIQQVNDKFSEIAHTKKGQ